MLEPVFDQWSYLASLPKIDLTELQRLLETSCSHEKDSEPSESASLNFDESALNVIPQAVRRGDFKCMLKLLRNSQIVIPLADLPDSKHLWMRDYWDRYIRNDRHFENVVLYIHQNPVKAGLCEHAEDWPWSSDGTPRSSLANEGVGVPGPA